MKVNFLRVLIFAQVAVILILVPLVYFRKNDILGASVSINPLKKEDLLFTSDKDLKQFYEPRPNSSPKETRTYFEGELEYIINSESLRSSVDYTPDKPDGVYRIIALGDSFTYGLMAEEADSYPKQLEKLLNSKQMCSNIQKFEVINLGVPGYDIEYSVKRFEKRGRSYNPDLVLWLLKQDDFAQILEFTKEKKDTFDKALRESGKMEEYYKKGIYYPGSGKMAKEIENQFGEDQILDYQLSVLKSIENYYNGKLLIFSFPFLEDKYKKIIENFKRGREGTYYHDRLVDVYKLKQAFVDDHPNKWGYSSMAQDLFHYLNTEGIIPCED